MTFPTSGCIGWTLWLREGRAGHVERERDQFVRSMGSEVKTPFVDPKVFLLTTLTVLPGIWELTPSEVSV